MMNKINRFRFYIGWNNETHKREILKATKIFNDNKVLGLSIFRDVRGVWGGVAENSFCIEVLSTTDNVLTTKTALDIKKQLEEELKQYLVIFSKEEVNLYI